MEIAITKEDFERSLPVGKRAGNDVYEKVKTEIDNSLNMVRNVYLGKAGEDQLETVKSLQTAYTDVVCLTGTLNSLRQLDLVLTPTGFGVVSNNNLAPASKQRVDSLEAALRTQLLRRESELFYGLRSENWGASPQARRAIPYFFDLFYFFTDSSFRTNANAQKWDDIQDPLREAWIEIRRYMGDEMLSELLDAYRKADDNRMVKYHLVIEQIQLIMDRWTIYANATMHKPEWRLLFSMMESDEVNFNKWKESSAYKLTHYEHFQNTKESTAFLFNG